MDAQTRREILGRVRIGQYTDSLDEPWIACNPINRQALIDMLHAVQEKGDKRGINISMGCGKQKRFEIEADIPYEDLRCPCGREGHWVVRYSTEPIDESKLAYIT